MDSLEDDIISQLLRVTAKILQKQRDCRVKIVSLEQILNNVHSSTYVKQKEIPRALEKPEVVETLNQEKIINEIDHILNQAEEKMLSIEMVASGTAAKPKVETKPANIVEKVVMEKKPPLPTVNRAAEKTHNKLTSLKYVPPRNKNEVTGKVTENLIQSKDKVFRPNRSSDSLTKNTDSNSKQCKSTSKQPLKTATIKQSFPINPNKSLKQTNSNFKRQQPTNQSKKLVQPASQQTKVDKNLIKSIDKPQQIHKLHILKKPISQLIEEFSAKHGKNRKHILARMIEQYTQQQRGHRGKQQKSRQLFLKHLNNLSVSRNHVVQEPGHLITNRKWEKCKYTFRFEEQLAALEHQLSSLEVSEDCVMDPKICYRLQYKFNSLQQDLAAILAGSEAEVPEKLQLSFEFAEQNVANDELEQSRPDQTAIYQNLKAQLQDLMNSQELQQKELSKLRMLVEVCLHGSKRSPVMLQSEEYKEWQKHYLDGS